MNNIRGQRDNGAMSLRHCTMLIAFVFLVLACIARPLSSSVIPLNSTESTWGSTPTPLTPFVYNETIPQKPDDQTSNNDNVGASGQELIPNVNETVYRPSQYHANITHPANETVTILESQNSKTMENMTAQHETVTRIAFSVESSPNPKDVTASTPKSTTNTELNDAKSTAQNETNNTTVATYNRTTSTIATNNSPDNATKNTSTTKSTTTTTSIPQIERSKCQQDFYRVVTNLANESWAVPFMESWGRPGPSISKGWVNFVGNYDECRDASAPPSGPNTQDGFRGRYCVLKVAIPDISDQLNFGLCFPDSCTSIELQSLLAEMLQSGSFNVSNSIPQGHSNALTVKCMDANTEVTSATVIAIILITIVVILMTSSTLYDYFYIHECQQKPANAFFKSLLAFSAYSNGKQLLKTSTSSPDSVSSVNGIRFFSICWVILGHVYFNGIHFSINVKSAFEEYLSRWAFDPVSNTYVAVDTFFAMSGMLVAYLTLQEFAKKESLKINWLMFYFHRFWRLTPAYMFVLVTVLGLQQYMGDGPFWSDEQPKDKTNCQENWWTNFLYVNNLVHTDELCMTHSWYLANDMQFHVISPLLLIPFHFGYVVGMVTCSVCLLACWITTGVVSADNHWPASELVYPSHQNDDWLRSYYIKPWFRVGPFIVGVMAGYALIKIKGKSLVLNKRVAIIGWVITLATALAILFGPHGDYSGEDVSDNSTAAFYNAVHRSTWAACVCWVILSCEGGYGGPVARFLSWAPFKVFSRMTYMAYLVHPTIISVFFQNVGMLYYTNDATQCVFFLGICVLTYLVAFVGVLAVESPMIGLEKALFNNKKKT